MLTAEPNATTSAGEDVTPPPDRLTPEQMTATRRCLAVLGVLSTGSMIGVSFSLYLVGHYPLLLAALSPLGRHVVLAAPVANPVALVVVTAVRRMAFYLSCFYLGRALGPAGIPWIEKRAARFAVMVRWVESLFSRAPRLVVLLMAGPTVSALAGVSGMSTWTYSSLAIVSVVVRLVAIVVLAEWLREYLEVALDWIDEYWLPGTVLMVTGVALYTWRRNPRAALTND